MMKRKQSLRAGAIAGALALGLTACGGGGGGGEATATEEGTAAASGGAGETINLGFLPSWTDGLSLAYLWDHVLTEQGYEVEMTEVADAAPLFTGIAQGDVDVFPSAWPEVTHASYMEQYGEDLENIGDYYEGAVLTLAVPEYTEIDSIPELAENADMFGGEIIGIEAGAGHTENMKNSVIPAYGLDEAGLSLVESSTTAMLAELQTAVDNEEDIVVTLWRPFWANSSFPVKDLEDPEGAMGEPEPLSAVATAGFSEEQPEVAEMMGNLKLDDETYNELEDLVVNEYGEGQEPEAIDAFFEANPEVMDQILGN